MSDIEKIRKELFDKGRWTFGGDGSHWDGCEETHWDCALVHLNARIAELEAKIARLVEVGDKAINAVMDETGFATMCPICRFTDDDQEVMTHSPDCPVTLWNKEAHE